MSTRGYAPLPAALHLRALAGPKGHVLFELGARVLSQGCAEPMCDGDHHNSDLRCLRGVSGGGLGAHRLAARVV